MSDNEFNPQHIAEAWIESLGQLPAAEATRDAQEKVTMALAFKTAAEIADRHCLMALENEGLAPVGDTKVWRFARAEDGGEASSHEESSDDVKLAVQWLLPRGLVQLVQNGRGFVFPGEG